MKLERNFLYHVYNRGNNGEKIFYSQRNYLYFLEKIRDHLLPYSDILAWCLMPNHFHLVIIVRREMVVNRSINQSIGKMLSSYARAINKQEKRSGSLFQQHTKASCLNNNRRLRPSWYKLMGASKINSFDDCHSYPVVCMNYVHMNPVNAGLVMDPLDWPWSSYREIYELAPELNLVNLDLVKNVVPL